MGTGASVKYATVNEALEAGKTQDEINAYLAMVSRSAAVTAPPPNTHAHTHARTLTHSWLPYFSPRLSIHLVAAVPVQGWGTHQGNGADGDNCCVGSSGLHFCG